METKKNIMNPLRTARDFRNNNSTKPSQRLTQHDTTYRDADIQNNNKTNTSHRGTTQSDANKKNTKETAQ